MVTNLVRVKLFVHNMYILLSLQCKRKIDLYSLGSVMIRIFYI